MKDKLRKIEVATRDWMLEHADRPGTQILLAAVSFFEASFLPLPPSTVMLAMVVLGQRGRWLYLALFTTITSVLGGLFGYFIGSVLYDTLGIWIITQYGLVEEMSRIGGFFSDNAFWALFVAAFTPVPYKAFTIAGGFFSINLFVFTIASLIGRGLRFIILAYLGELFGEHFTSRIFRYFALTTILALVAVALFVVAASL